MGLLSFLALSAKKTTAMNKAAKLMLNPNVSSLQAAMAHDEAISKAFDELYAQMKAMPGFSDILNKHNAPSNDLKEIASRTQLAGYSFASNRDFIPVAVVSFGSALDYVLTNKDKILNYTYEEVCDVIDIAVTLLQQ